MIPIILSLLGTVVVGVLAGVIAGELKAWLWLLSAWIVRRAAQVMGADLEERYRDIYLGELDSLRDRPLTAIAVSLRIRWRAYETMLVETIGDSPPPRSLAAKALMDRIGGFVLLLLALPLLLLVMAFVAITTGRPIFYALDRIGRHGKPFTLYKFRTMATATNGYRASEPYVPPLGKTLRAARLDELPQLWNVVKGDMSLVGPGPELPAIVATYADWQHGRHAVKPGLTGPWQISPHNSEPMHLHTEMDVDYIKRWSFWSDLKLLLATPIAMLRRRH